MLPDPAGSMASQGRSSPLSYRRRNRNPGVRLGPCPKPQQGQARLPGASPRKPSDTALFLTLLATGMSSHRKKKKKRPPFGSCGHLDAAKYQEQDSGCWHS